MINSITYNGYTASITYSSIDEVFFGKVLGVNDLITFEGTSVSELKESLQEAVDDYLATCKALGKAPDKTYKGVFNVRVPSILHKKAANIASKLDVTLNDYIKSVLEYAVNHEDITSEVVVTKQADYIYAKGK